MFLYFFSTKMQNSALFQHFFTHFFTKLARLCALKRQYQPKNEHSPSKPPKIFPQIPHFFKKSRKSHHPKPINLILDTTA